MNKKLILFPIVALIAAVSLCSNATGPGATSGRDATGASGTAGCTGAGCHSPSATPGIVVTLELDSAGVAVSHYFGGNTYTIKITGTNTTSNVLPKFGFQVEAVKISGAGTSSATNAGTIATTGLPTSCQNSLVSGRHLVEHSARLSPISGTGASGTVYTESISWTAPAAGTGTVKFYTALNAVNNDLSSSGDFWNNTSLPITESIQPIKGPTAVCDAGTITLADSTVGGTWSSASPGVATIDPSLGVVTGVHQGTVNIVYTVGLTSDTAVITVIAPPGPIGGNVAMCTVGSTITLTDSATGGNWSGGTIGTAIVGSSSGVVTSGIIAGNATITYTTGCGSSALAIITVNPPSAPIEGNVPMCASGPAITLTDSTSGGIWSGGTWTGGTTSLVTVDFLTGVCTPGATAGTTTLTYTSVCGTEVFTTVTINAAPSSVTGSTPMCPGGSTIVLSETGYGGFWTSGDTSVATVDSVSGTVTPGMNAGTVMISYSNGCGSASTVVTINPLPYVSVISGSGSFCQGTFLPLSDSVAGGTWTSSNPAAVPVLTSGDVYGILAEAATITYTATNSCGSAFATFNVVVNPLPSAGVISCSSPEVCVGTSPTYTDIVLGGVWNFNTPTVATIDSFSGILTALTAGSGLVSYSTTNSCGSTTTTAVVTVNAALTAGTIFGDSVVCQGAGISLSESISGGSWSSGDVTIATVDSFSGMVTGIGGGNVLISYTIVSACGTAVATYPVTVNPLANVGTISGSSILCQSKNDTLAETVIGGTWSTSDATIATINPATGVVTGVSGGSIMISYAETNGCGVNYATYNMTVNPLPYVGMISGPASICLGSSVSYTDTTGGGAWTSSAATVLTVDPLSGLSSAIGDGTSVVTYMTTNGCGTSSVSLSVAVLSAPSGLFITGGSEVCVGASIFLTGSEGDGTWLAQNSNAEVVDGTVTGLASGMDSIYYTYTNICGTATTAINVSVNPLPDPGVIAGTTSVCVGATATLTETASGGTWSSAFGDVTFTGPGDIVGDFAGIDTVYYTASNSCGTLVSEMVITINPLPVAGLIVSASGGYSVCVGDTLQLLATTSGGTWTALNGNASVDASGMVTGNIAGTDVIDYTVTTVCGSNSVTSAITINPLPFAATITGLDSLCPGHLTDFTASISGGVWASTQSSIATISDSGFLIAVAPGIDTVIYTTSNICGNAIASRVVLVLSQPMAGTIICPDTVCAGAGIALVDSSAGGNWWVTDSTLGTISGDIFTGVTGGLEHILYTVSNSCGSDTANHTLFVRGLANPGTISGSSFVCVGSPFSLTDSVAGGTWSSGDAAIATVSDLGAVLTFSQGVDTIYYSVSNVCGPVSARFALTVDTVIKPSLSGRSYACTGSSLQMDTLIGVPTGGSWTTSMTSDSVNAMGYFFGNVTGAVNVVYSVVNACGTFDTTLAISVLSVRLVACVD